MSPRSLVRLAGTPASMYAASLSVSPCRARSKTCAASCSTSGSWAGSCSASDSGLCPGVGSVMEHSLCRALAVEEGDHHSLGRGVTRPDVQRDARPAVTGDEERTEKGGCRIGTRRESHRRRGTHALAAAEFQTGPGALLGSDRDGHRPAVTDGGADQIVPAVGIVHAVGVLVAGGQPAQALQGQRTDRDVVPARVGRGRAGRRPGAAGGGGGAGLLAGQWGGSVDAVDRARMFDAADRGAGGLAGIGSCRRVLVGTPGAAGDQQQCPTRHTGRLPRST
ncbi:exported hypothetical protein [Actinacidiphila cocklensis]|uniref:Uncharacterized protein n=1 Tax=Actinacidiphila cocklensis TaxID=887465 RepID=A0A9W4GTF5_9ACTN|nr:exported hypothetical protein [Actinacidiphila cocklensis]